MAKKLYIGNLSYRATEDDLTKKFSEVGQCVSVKIIVDKFTGRSKGFAFVEMEKDEEAQEAIDKLNGTAMYGRGMIVSEARPPRQRKPGPGRRRKF